MKFTVCVADPPWSFSDKLNMSDVKRGALANYSTMSTEEIMALPIKELADPDGAILALWVPSAILQDGLDVMRSWGFIQKQTYIWAKSKQAPFKELFHKTAASILSDDPITTDTFKQGIKAAEEACRMQLNNMLSFGMGRLFRGCHEICLIGINNSGIYKKLENRSQRSVCFDTNLKHSAKPEHLQNSLDMMFPDKSLNRIELFARRQRRGWHCVGNESPTTQGEDIRVSLERLKNVNDDNG